MARTRRTREIYQRLIEAFREKPGNASHAARRAKCERRMAKTAWEKGWSGLSLSDGNDDLPPIRELVDKDHIRRRAEAKNMTLKEAEATLFERYNLPHEARERIRARKQREDGAAQAETAKSAEERIAQATLGTAGGMLATAQRLRPEMQQLADEMKRLVQEKIKDPKLSLDQGMKLLKQYFVLTGMASGMASEAVNLSRKVAGEPDNIVQMVKGASHSIDKDLARQLFNGDKDRLIGAMRALVNNDMTEDARKLMELNVSSQNKDHHPVH